jgi:hypothetical protein
MPDQPQPSHRDFVHRGDRRACLSSKERILEEI